MRSAVLQIAEFQVSDKKMKLSFFKLALLKCTQSQLSDRVRSFRAIVPGFSAVSQRQA